MARVLIVEDDAEFCESLRELLELEGCDVHAVGALYLALEALAGQDLFDLVMLDLLLPDSRQLPAVRAVHSATRARVIAMTALSPDDVPRDLPVEAVLYKPFGREELRRFIHRRVQPGRPTNEPDHVGSAAEPLSPEPGAS